MRWLLILPLLASCAHESPHRAERPDWVAAVRSGEETLKSVHGNKVYYRRIAGQPELSREVSCGLAVTKAEEDIKKEHPLLPRVPFTVEVLFYDPEHHDCAATVSVPADLASRYGEMRAEYGKAVKRREELAQQEHVSEDEVTEMLQLRAETAVRYALVGLGKDEFEQFAKDPVRLLPAGGECERVFRAPAYSIHGGTQICWRDEHIVGHCTSADRQCWTKIP